MDEEWRWVPSVPGLLASSWGRILILPSFGSGQNKNKQYGTTARYGAWDENTRRFVFAWRRRTWRVARLVCEAFHGPPPVGREVCLHLDEDSHNNKPSNLMWGTQKENLNAPGFIEYCKSRTGDNHPKAKRGKN